MTSCNTCTLWRKMQRSVRIQTKKRLNSPSVSLGHRPLAQRAHRNHRHNLDSRDTVTDFWVKLCTTKNWNLSSKLARNFFHTRRKRKNQLQENHAWQKKVRLCLYTVSQRGEEPTFSGIIVKCEESKQTQLRAKVSQRIQPCKTWTFRTTIRNSTRMNLTWRPNKTTPGQLST